jgi:hypothetical protein
MSKFGPAVLLGARLSGADPKSADVHGITAQAEAVVAQILGTPEATLRTIIRNKIASPHHSTWFESGTEWGESLIAALGKYWSIGYGLKPYWRERRRALVVIEGGCTPNPRPGCAPVLHVLRGGAR